jgi:hypothetical protein
LLSAVDNLLSQVRSYLIRKPCSGQNNLQTIRNQDLSFLMNSDRYIAATKQRSRGVRGITT